MAEFSRTFMTPKESPPPVGYSHIAKVSNATLIYLAGQVPMDASGTLVGPGDFKAQAEQVFRNVRTALNAAGATPHDIIKLNYYVVASVDPSVRTAIRGIRDQYVNTATPPASTLVVVAGLAQPGWLIEIEAVAAIAG
jgi:enamine deaminase RidA (YjgF/YER057c/UK114 family)